MEWKAARGRPGPFNSPGRAWIQTAWEGDEFEKVRPRGAGNCRNHKLPDRQCKYCKFRPSKVPIVT